MLYCRLVTRRSLTSAPELIPGLSPTRRLGGTRRETSDRVRFKVGAREVEGWALNLSRGGLRAIVDEPIDLGTEVEVAIADAAFRPSRIVWIQEEPDGAIVGVEFLDIEGPASIPPPEPAPSSSPDDPAGSGDR